MIIWVVATGFIGAIGQPILYEKYQAKQIPKSDYDLFLDVPYFSSILMMIWAVLMDEQVRMKLRLNNRKQSQH